jgi:hypothetical protein
VCYSSGDDGDFSHLLGEVLGHYVD